MDFLQSQVPIYDNMSVCLTEVKADVFIDLTTPEVGMNHTRKQL